MTVGDCFAGIGGFSLAASRVWGWNCVKWQIEIDPWCRRVLAKHWPEVRRYEDIRTVEPDALDRVGIVCGGFPCQDVARCGERAGMDGTRSGLWSEMARVVGALRPRYVVVENVAGLLDRGLGRVLGDLAALGFDAEWGVLSSCAVGAPHARERVFVVAYAAGTGLQRRGSAGPGPALLEPQGCGAEHRRPGTVEPRPVGVAYGLPGRLDRLRGLGNAVDPRVAEMLFRWIDAAEREAE